MNWLSSILERVDSKIPMFVLDPNWWHFYFWRTNCSSGVLKSKCICITCWRCFYAVLLYVVTSWIVDFRICCSNLNRDEDCLISYDWGGRRRYRVLTVLLSLTSWLQFRFTNVQIVSTLFTLYLFRLSFFRDVFGLSLERGIIAWLNQNFFAITEIAGKIRWSDRKGS